MLRRHRACALALFVGAVAASPVKAAGTHGLVLEAVGQNHGHIIANADFAGLAPAYLVVATKPRRLATGALSPMNVRLRQAIRPTRPVNGLVRIHVRKRLPAGTYYVQVSAVEGGGVTDCSPHQYGCGDTWSNVLRVVIPLDSPIVNRL
jgi:hypothetical protein